MDPLALKEAAMLMVDLNIMRRICQAINAVQFANTIVKGKLDWAEKEGL